MVYCTTAAIARKSHLAANACGRLAAAGQSLRLDDVSTIQRSQPCYTSSRVHHHLLKYSRHPQLIFYILQPIPGRVRYAYVTLIHTVRGKKLPRVVQMASSYCTCPTQALNDGVLYAHFCHVFGMMQAVHGIPFKCRCACLANSKVVGHDSSPARFAVTMDNPLE